MTEKSPFRTGHHTFFWKKDAQMTFIVHTHFYQCLRAAAVRRSRRINVGLQPANADVDTFAVAIHGAKFYLGGNAGKEGGVATGTGNHIGFKMRDHSVTCVSGNTMLALSTNELYLTQGLKAAKAANSNETDSVWKD